jgi:hypothetical protein
MRFRIFVQHHDRKRNLIFLASSNWPLFDCRMNDCILRVNNLDCSNASKRMLIDAIRSSASNCSILVKRRRIGARSLFTTQVFKSIFQFSFDYRIDWTDVRSFLLIWKLQLNNYDHGLLLETGMYICKIAPGSLAAKEGNLAIGDRVLSVSS